MRAWIRREPIICLLLPLLALQSLVYLVKYVGELTSQGLRFGGDFTVFWKAAQVIPSQNWTLLYAPAAVHGSEVMPFVYPPPMLLLLAPFSRLSYDVAVALWLGMTGALYLLAVVDWSRRFELARTPRRLSVLLAFVALSPFVLTNLLAGQTGFLIGALGLWGLYHLPRRPVLAGALIGGLVVKPHLALLFPFLLLFARQGRALLAMVLTSAVLCGLSTVLYGPGVWRAYGDGVAAFMPLIPDILPQLQEMLVGFGPFFIAHGWGREVHALQLLMLLLSLAALWRMASPRALVQFHSWSRTLPRSLAERGKKRALPKNEGKGYINAPFALNWARLGAMLCLLAFLASPYAMAYDFTLLILPVLFLIAPMRHRPLSSRERLTLVVLLLMPMIGVAMQAHGWPVFWPLLALAAWGMLKGR